MTNRGTRPSTAKVARTLGSETTRESPTIEAKSGFTASTAVATLSPHHLDLEFSANLLGREQLAGIESAQRIENLLHRPHHVQVVLGKKQRHQGILFDSDTVFTRDGAPHVHTLGDDFLGCLEHPRDLFPVPRVKHDQRVKVSVAGVENIGDAETVTAFDITDEFQ